MGRMIDVDALFDYFEDDAIDEITISIIEYFVSKKGTVEAIPKEEVRQFIENIQKIKDNHNEYGEPINYGTICGILIEGHRLLDKYREGKDGNDD